MKIYIYYIVLIVLPFFSCSKTKQGDLLEIPIDVYKNSLIPLSEIAEEITTIELELTDESLINPERVRCVLVSKNEVFIATANSILVFNKAGEFIRSIGFRGQGPGEYTNIRNLTLDETNKRLFIISNNQKIISYDFNGNFLEETTLLEGFFNDINYINEKLLLLVSNNQIDNDSRKVYSNWVLYQLNDNLQVVDSCLIKDLYAEGSPGIALSWTDDFILKGDKSIYLYYGDIFWRESGINEVFRDTLFRFEDNNLMPNLKLKFKEASVNKFIHLFNLYRSSRYIFAIYVNNQEKGFYSYCYDSKTGEDYNFKSDNGYGYTDDINQIEGQVRIRPLKLDTEMFYYLHTHMKPYDLEEPNPTLYIGKLKK